MVCRPSLTGLAILGLVLTFERAAAEIWVDFYQSQSPRETRQNSQDSDVCMREILRAQAEHDIPDNLLLAIGIQEAGRQVSGKLTIWPWTANADGRGAFFESKQALEKWVRETQSSGVQSIDVGCMQVNQKWHAQEFASLSEATDPAANVNYAARFLTALYAESRDWQEAAGRYHSSTPEFKERYLGKLAHNQKIANSVITTVGAGTELRVAQRAQPSFNWSADMTGSAAKSTQEFISIYTATPLRPILPKFEGLD